MFANVCHPFTTLAESLSVTFDLNLTTSLQRTTGTQIHKLNVYIFCHMTQFLLNSWVKRIYVLHVTLTLHDVLCVVQCRPWATDTTDTWLLCLYTEERTLWRTLECMRLAFVSFINTLLRKQDSKQLDKSCNTGQDIRYPCRAWSRRLNWTQGSIMLPFSGGTVRTKGVARRAGGLFSTQ